MRSTGATLCVVAVLVAACGSEASAPQVTESPSQVEPTSPTTAAPVPPSSTSTTVDEPPPTVSPTHPPTTVEEPAATTTTTAPTPLSGPVTLRGDGLGAARFGRPMVEVEQWLVGEFGAPVWETVARAPLAASQWYEARELFRSLSFEIGELSPETGHVTSLVVRFSDVSDARDDGIAHLAGWETWHVGTEGLAVPAGLEIGMSLAELKRGSRTWRSRLPIRTASSTGSRSSRVTRLPSESAGWCRRMVWSSASRQESGVGNTARSRLHRRHRTAR